MKARIAAWLFRCAPSHMNAALVRPRMLVTAGMVAVSCVLVFPARSQSIRGTIIDESSKLPIQSVLLTVVDENGNEVLPGVRSDSLGNFMVHASRAGTWKVRAVRIGYNPITSDQVNLAIGGLAVVRLRMTTVAQQLIPVQIVERRQLSANELMSTAGFDLRESRGIGKFLGTDRLEAMGQDGIREILGTFFQPALFVTNDPVLGDVLRMRQGINGCAPEIFLDGRLIATAPGPRALVDGPPPTSPMDSLRATMRQESDSVRVAFDQQRALSVLSSLTAAMVHGIEVYRSYEVPPASLGAWFGMTKTAIRTCGTVAVWTKAGALSVVAARRVATPGRAVQVVMGTLLDYDTGVPLAGRPVRLLTEGGDDVGNPLTTDRNGEFSFRTSRAGNLRLTAGGDGYLQSVTGPFTVSANELLFVKLFVSSRQGVLAPLGIGGRVQAQNIGASSLAGFTYRRERAQGGVFFRSSDIEQLGARTVLDVLRAVKALSIINGPPPRVVITNSDPRRATAAACAPTLLLDGKALSGDALATALAQPSEKVFGIEVYAIAGEIPNTYTDLASCGLIVVWSRN